MRTCIVFVTGLLIGAGIQAVAAQGSSSANKGIVGVNHVGITVPDVEKTVAYYTKTLGFPEAFRVNLPTGQPRLVYVQVSRNTFIEIQPGTGPAAINHVGIVVDNMDAATAMFKQRGATIGEINRGSDTKAILNNITDMNGLRIELAELPAASMHRQAMERWK